NHGDVALLRAELVDHTLPDADRARRGLLETGDQAEHRGLPAARRSHEDHELAVVDGERQVGEGARPAGIDLVDVLELDARHRTQSKNRSAARMGSAFSAIGSEANRRWTSVCAAAFAPRLPGAHRASSSTSAGIRASNMLPPHDGTYFVPFHSYQPPKKACPRTSFRTRPCGVCVCHRQLGANVRAIANQCSSGTSPLPMAIRLPSRDSA